MTKAKLYFVRMETSNRGPIACGHFLGLDNADACRRAEYFCQMLAFALDLLGLPVVEIEIMRPLERIHARWRRD